MPLYQIPGPDAFRSWLIKRAGRGVGRVGRTASCPLATWLRQVNKNRRLHVAFAGSNLVLADPDEPCGLFEIMPPWCADFVEEFDTRVEPGPTTGAVALSFLNDVLPPALD